MCSSRLSIWLSDEHVFLCSCCILDKIINRPLHIIGKKASLIIHNISIKCKGWTLSIEGSASRPCNFLCLMYSHLQSDQSRKISQIKFYFHCLRIIFLELKVMLSASSASQLIWCGFKGVTRTISKCSVDVYPNASTINTSFSLLQTATLFQNLLMRLYEAIKYDKIVFLLAIAIQGECRLQSNLFWPMMPILFRLLVGLLSGPNLTLVRNNFLKWLTFQRYPLVLRTIIQFAANAKGTPQTKGYMMTLFLMFQLQLTSALLVLPILQTYLLLSLMMQKQRLTFYQFQILKLKPPPKRVMLTFFQPQRVQQLKPQPNFLNYIGIFGAFFGGFFQMTLEIGMQELYTLSHDDSCILDGDSMQNLQIQLSLFRSSHFASPKALQRQRPFAMKVECLLQRHTQSPV